MWYDLSVMHLAWFGRDAKLKQLNSICLWVGAYQTFSVSNTVLEADKQFPKLPGTTATLNMKCMSRMKQT